MTYNLSTWTIKYSSYVEGTIIGIIVLLIVGYFGNWIEHCNCKRISSMCCASIKDKKIQLVFSIALTLWLQFIVIYVLNSITDHQLWDIAHYIYAIIYPFFCLYIMHHLYEIHRKYGSILLFIQLKSNTFTIFIGILFIAICVAILEWITLINGINWQSTDQTVQIALAFFGLDATAILLVFKMKEVESIKWAFTSMNNSGFTALEQFINKNIVNNKISRCTNCSCNMFLFTYFGICFLFQCFLLALVTYSTVEDRWTNIETWLFYSCLPFVFAPLFILTYFIHQHHKSVQEVDYTRDDNTIINAFNDDSIYKNKVTIRQKKLDKYKCIGRIYQLLIVLIFLCTLYLTLIVSLSPHMTNIDVNLYLFGQFKNLYYIFIFLLLLFMENKQTLNQTWKCNQCLFNNDCNQNDVHCQLCGYERINIALNPETQTLVTKIIDNNRINIKKEFDDLKADIKIFGKEHMKTTQCSVQEIKINIGLETCQFVQRVTFVSLLYKQLQNKNDFDRYFDALTAEKQYTISDLLNDFAHVLDHCSFDVNDQTIFKYVENIAGECIKTCKSSARHIARRYSRDNNQNVYLEKQLLLRTMDRIHCFLFHNFQRERNDGGITQIARPRIECPDRFCEWKHSDTIPYSQLDADLWKMTNEQREHIAQYHKQLHIRLQNYETDKKQKTYVQSQPEEKTDVEYGDFGEFSFGSFIYYELLSPQHCSLKKEIEAVKDNDLVSIINVHIWDLMWLKASKLSECNKAKQIRNVDNSLQFISIEHILSIVLYTDCDDLQKP